MRFVLFQVLKSTNLNIMASKINRALHDESTTNFKMWGTSVFCTLLCGGYLIKSPYFVLNLHLEPKTFHTPVAKDYKEKLKESKH